MAVQRPQSARPDLTHVKSRSRLPIITTEFMAEQRVKDLADPDPEIRRRSAELLGLYGSAESIEPLRKASAMETILSCKLAIVHAINELEVRFGLIPQEPCACAASGADC